MKTAVIYARYSSSSQTEQSIEGQLRVCKEFAERNGYVVINNYIDRAMTGTNDRRPAFLQMIEDSKQQNFDFVICYKLDRFSRKKYDSVVYKHKLEQNGVKVISATESISNTSEGKLIEGLLEMMAEMYSDDLSMKVRRGIRESVLKGNFIGGKVLLGYKIENKKVLIDEKTKDIVIEIFKRYAEGETQVEIIKWLNSEGNKLITNRTFVKNSIQHLLKNKKYIGIVEHNGIVYENTYPAIIDKNIFEIVQKKLQSNKHFSGSFKTQNEDYSLSGKIFCAHCGATIVGMSGTSKQSTTHYYYCCSNRLKAKCKKGYEKKEELESSILTLTSDFVLTEKNILFLSKKIYDYFNSSDIKLKIKDYENKINRLNRELDKCLSLMLKSTSDEILTRLDSQAKEYSIQKKDIETEINKLKLVTNITKTEKEIKDYLTLFINKGTENKTLIFDSFINSIWLYDKKTIIFYNLFDKKPPINFDEFENYIKENGISIDTGFLDKKKGVLILTPMAES